MNILRSLLSQKRENYTVQEISPNELNGNVIAEDGLLKLFDTSKKKKPEYELILTLPAPVPKYWRLFVVDKRELAEEQFTLYSTYLLPIVPVDPSIISRLQDVCNAVRARLSGGLVHLCVQLQLLKALQSNHLLIVRSVDYVDGENATGLHLACQDPKISDEVVQHLIYMGADVSKRDAHGETAYTHCAPYSPSKLKILTQKKSEAINLQTVVGETAVHKACAADQPECLEILLAAGANPMLSDSYQLPIHCAVKSNSVRCLEILIKYCPSLVSAVDGKFGGTALHWAKKKEVVDCLLELGTPIDALSLTNDTALHIMLKEDRRDCVSALLTNGANVALPNHDGETPLHIAIPTDDFPMVLSLIVHGADVNLVDRNGISPRHVAATMSKNYSSQILYALHMVGAQRCRAGQFGCTEGCKHNGKFDGKKIGNSDDEQDIVDDFCDEVFNISCAAAACSLDDGNMKPPVDGSRVLCLDGGGIRGLVLGIMLLKLEKILNTKLVDAFDWITGTSTGAILGLALASGRDARYCICMYMKMKDKVFCGNKPYSSERLEDVLRKEFGADTPMSAIRGPKVMVTALLADRHPPDLYLFKNYINPIDTCITPQKRLFACDSPIPKPEDVKIWEAARCSGAAPTFFRPALNRFLDGGLMSNNPTLDTLTEIHEYNSGLRVVNQGYLVKPVKCVLSLGTGRMPKTKVTSIDVFRPSSPLDVLKVASGAQSLLKIIVEQATQSEGRVNERARAWCSTIGASFFRLSPQLSEEVGLDEVSDDKLYTMCWETMVYLHKSQDKLNKIASVLKR